MVMRQPIITAWLCLWVSHSMVIFVSSVCLFLLLQLLSCGFVLSRQRYSWEAFDEFNGQSYLFCTWIHHDDHISPTQLMDLGVCHRENGMVILCPIVFARDHLLLSRSLSICFFFPLMIFQKVGPHFHPEHPPPLLSLVWSQVQS